MTTNYNEWLYDEDEFRTTVQNIILTDEYNTNKSDEYKEAHYNEMLDYHQSDLEYFLKELNNVDLNTVPNQKDFLNRIEVTEKAVKSLRSHKVNELHEISEALRTIKF